MLIFPKGKFSSINLGLGALVLILTWLRHGRILGPSISRALSTQDTFEGSSEPLKTSLHVSCEAEHKAVVQLKRPSRPK